MSYRSPDPYGVVDAWMSAEPSERLRDIVREWLFKLAEDPDSMGGVLIPEYASSQLAVYGRTVPGTSVVVLWQVFRSPPWPRELECIVVCHIETTKR